MVRMPVMHSSLVPCYPSLITHTDYPSMRSPSGLERLRMAIEGSEVAGVSTGYRARCRPKRVARRVDD
jgi:hypothetical protein